MDSAVSSSWRAAASASRLRGSWPARSASARVAARASQPGSAGTVSASSGRAVRRVAVQGRGDATAALTQHREVFGGCLPVGSS